jgi:hypothetical protein
MQGGDRILKSPISVQRHQQLCFESGLVRSSDDAMGQGCPKSEAGHVVEYAGYAARGLFLDAACCESNRATDSKRLTDELLSLT